MTREPDACPGLIQLHDAADGPLARIRIPGGVVTAAQLEALAHAAESLGNGEMELTSRGNIQLRAVRDAGQLQHELQEAGLLPSLTHERIRNIVASPLSGRSGGLADIRPLIAELDSALQAVPELASLPGRVLFGIDDGRGDIMALAPDFGVQATAAGFALVLAGQDSGARTNAPVDTIVNAARAFGEVRTDEWRLSDVEEGATKVLRRLRLTRTAVPRTVEAPDHPIGWFDQPDGHVTLAGGLKFGTLSSRLAQFIAAVEAPITITPWRSIVISDLDEGVADTVLRVLAPLGMIFDAHSPWLHVTACAGRPGCAKALADVRGDAAAAIENGTLPLDGPQHWSGCERRCGKPKSAGDVVATTDGYEANYG
ncbi:precorrin-3B synthase [Smaragdicoccus niigatensis]|uniref:precorrin-3B synthase n=1 Tax=Smaragdicoccus niigatensis TaxID=359359 RepID=UPI00035E7052|nr:precorrin-3B synthase [Smaragdicoccus niigatensis]